MKRIIALALLLFAAAATASAQDLITKKTGEDIQAKVLEVTPGEVKYRLWEEPDGVIYTVKKSDLLLIRYESGRNEVFNTNVNPNIHTPWREPVEGLTTGMKYSELKNLYDYRDWYAAPGDKYSPVWSGVASLFIPGLGQMICDEAGRGLAWLGGAVGCSAAYYIGILLAFAECPAGFALFYAAPLGMIAVNICSIIDAVKVAKVKNMYFQDLRSQYSLDVELYPSVNCVQTATGIRPAAGLTLAIRF